MVQVGIATMAICAAHQTQAADFFWTGCLGWFGHDNTSWKDTWNWSNYKVALNTDSVACFSDSKYNEIYIDTQPSLAIEGLKFLNNASTYTITSRIKTFSLLAQQPHSGIINNSLKIQTLKLDPNVECSLGFSGQAPTVSGGPVVVAMDANSKFYVNGGLNSSNTPSSLVLDVPDASNARVFFGQNLNNVLETSVRNYSVGVIQNAVQITLGPKSNLNIGSNNSALLPYYRNTKNCPPGLSNCVAYTGQITGGADNTVTLGTDTNGFNFLLKNALCSSCPNMKLHIHSGSALVFAPSTDWLQINDPIIEGNGLISHISDTFWISLNNNLSNFAGHLNIAHATAGLRIHSAQPFFLQGNLTGSGTLRQSGTGLVTLPVRNVSQFTGIFDVAQNSTLVFLTHASSTALPNQLIGLGTVRIMGSGPFVLNDFMREQFQGRFDVDEKASVVLTPQKNSWVSSSFSGLGTIVYNGNGSLALVKKNLSQFNGNFVNNAHASLTLTENLSLSNAFSGTGWMTQTGPYALTVQANKLLSRIELAQQESTLIVNVSKNETVSLPSHLFSGVGTVQVTGQGAINLDLTENTQFKGSFHLDHPSVLILNLKTNQKFENNLSGSGSIIQTGPYILTVSRPNFFNDFTGYYTINRESTLIFTDSPHETSLIVNGVCHTQNDLKINSVLGSGSVYVHDHELTIQDHSHFSGSIYTSEHGGLRISKGARVILDGANQLAHIVIDPNSALIVQGKGQLGSGSILPIITLNGTLDIHENAHDLTVYSIHGINTDAVLQLGSRNMILSSSDRPLQTGRQLWPRTVNPYFEFAGHILGTGRVLIQAHQFLRYEGVLESEELINEGVLEPGTSNHMGIVDVQKNYQQGTNGSLRVKVNARGQSDVIQVHGKSKLRGRLLFDTRWGFQENQTYTFFYADHPIEGHFDNTSMDESGKEIIVQGLLEGQLETKNHSETHTYTKSVRLHLNEKAITQAAETKNQQSIAHQLLTGPVLYSEAINTLTAADSRSVRIWMDQKSNAMAANQLMIASVLGQEFDRTLLHAATEKGMWLCPSWTHSQFGTQEGWTLHSAAWNMGYSVQTAWGGLGLGLGTQSWNAQALNPERAKTQGNWWSIGTSAWTHVAPSWKIFGSISYGHTRHMHTEHTVEADENRWFAHASIQEDVEHLQLEGMGGRKKIRPFVSFTHQGIYAGSWAEYDALHNSQWIRAHNMHRNWSGVGFHWMHRTPWWMVRIESSWEHAWSNPRPTVQVDTWNTVGMKPNRNAWNTQCGIQGSVNGLRYNVDYIGRFSRDWYTHGIRLGFTHHF